MGGQRKSTGKAKAKADAKEKPKAKAAGRTPSVKAAQGQAPTLDAAYEERSVLLFQDDSERIQSAELSLRAVLSEREESHFGAAALMQAVNHARQLEGFDVALLEAAQKTLEARIEDEESRKQAVASPAGPAKLQLKHLIRAERESVFPDLQDRSVLPPLPEEPTPGEQAPEGGDEDNDSDMDGGHDEEKVREVVEQLFDAIDDGDLKKVTSLLALEVCGGQPVPIDITDHDGNTLLSDAACYGETEIAMLLLSKGAEPDTRNNLGRTPLWRACYNGHFAVAELLLKSGADSTLCNNVGEAPGKYGSPETKALIAEWDTALTGELRERRLLTLEESGVHAGGTTGTPATTPRGSRKRSKAGPLTLTKEQEDRLTKAIDAIFRLYDADSDGMIGRLEFLTAAEEEASLTRRAFGGQEKKAAMIWFKGMYAFREEFLDAKKADLAMKSGERPTSEAHVEWVCDLARRFRNLRLPREAKEPPAWPIKIGLRKLSQAIDTAHYFGRVPLVVCNGMEQPERFLVYSGEAIIDAMQVLNELYVKKSKPLERVQLDLKQALLAAMETHGFGLSLHVRMGTSACDFKSTLCAHGKFPAEVFGGSRRWNEAELRKHFPEPTVIIQQDFRVIVSTSFSMKEALKHLPKALPHFEEMAIIEIDKETN
eukprot:TRINITY_DN8523_c0_g1_i2.p1 TRINITY_DN8523_c0_g1~~TRINITY_DN8523_c0_g1_i2.p1  ORF type:complete len:656 (-),score=211.05 TRINITY_DN8523_c0_g1_i2:393-2360(-)